MFLLQRARSFDDSLFGVAKISQFEAFLPLCQERNAQLLHRRKRK
jgi:hypothetical protein